MNPNNCDTCDHMKLHRTDDDGHCYMFRDEPDEVCMQHTLRKVGIIGRPSILGMALTVSMMMNAPEIDANDDPDTDEQVQP